MIGPEASHVVELDTAVHGRDLGAHALCKLNGKGAGTATGAVDQYLLTRLHLPVIAQALQRQHGRLRHGRCLLKTQCLRLMQQPVLRRTDILGIRAPVPVGQVTDHRITGFEVHDIFPDRLDTACDIGTEDLKFRFEYAAGNQAIHKGLADQQAMIPVIERCGMHLYQYFVITGGWLWHVLYPDLLR